jgi:hypothetical protein
MELDDTAMTSFQNSFIDASLFRGDDELYYDMYRRINGLEDGKRHKK